MAATTKDAMPVADSARERSSMTSARSLKQLGLFMGGAAFLGLSSIMTRRALIRKYHAVTPKFFTNSQHSSNTVNGAVEAFEALTIATSYVFSGAFMFVGGALWACDVSTVEELRTMLRKQMGVEVQPGGDAETDKQIEEWMVGILAKKEMKEMAKELAKGPPPSLDKAWKKEER